MKISNILNIWRAVRSGSGPIGYVVHDDDTGLVGALHGTGGKNAGSCIFEL